MKAKFFMIAALAAVVGLTGCQKEGGDSNEGTEAVNISIKLDNEVLTGTRALDGITDLKQDRVTMSGSDPVYVYIFNSTGKLLQYDATTVGALTTGKTYMNSTNTLLTTSAKDVVVLANLDAAPAAVTSYAGLQAQIQTLTEAASRYSEGTTAVSSVIAVYGKSGITWGTATAGVTPGTANLALNPLFARIDATVSTNGAQGLHKSAPAAGTAGVVLKGVAVLYSGYASHYASDFYFTYAEAAAVTPTAVKALQSGLVAGDFTNWGAIGHGDAAQFGTKGAQTILHASWDGTWNGANNLVTTTYDVFSRSFYAFPPTAETDGSGYSAHTILTVYGDHYAEDGTVTPLFWPVHFKAGGDTAAALAQGQHYNVNINLKGDFRAGDGGNPDPEDVRKANVTVTITEAKWKPTITINKDFE